MILSAVKFQVLTNGIEVKLQRNALSVIEPPTGNEEDDKFDCENMQWNSSDMGKILGCYFFFFISVIILFQHRFLVSSSVTVRIWNSFQHACFPDINSRVDAFGHTITLNFLETRSITLSFKQVKIKSVLLLCHSSFSLFYA